MSLTFPITPPQPSAVEPSWPSYREAGAGLYRAYPHWLGLDYLLRPGDAVVAAIAAPAEESRLASLQIRRAPAGAGISPEEEAIVLESAEVYSLTLAARASGAIDLFYLLRSAPAPAAGVLLHRFSKDEGKSWSSAAELALTGSGGAPLPPAVRGAGVVRGSRDLHLPHLGAAVLRDGALALALHAAPPGSGSSCWIALARLQGDRWQPQPAHDLQISWPQQVEAHPWGGIEVSAIQTARMIRRLSAGGVPEQGAGAALISPGRIDLRRGGLHQAYLTADGISVPAWQATTGAFGVSPMPVRFHAPLPAFSAPRYGGDYYVSSAACMRVRQDGALELFHIDTAGNPAIARLRNTAGVSEWS